MRIFSSLFLVSASAKDGKKWAGGSSAKEGEGWAGEGKEGGNWAGASKEGGGWAGRGNGGKEFQPYSDKGRGGSWP
ncbi:hypothetical protein Vi05172_g13232 [Venturia inaequalis]|nr:hypothetical protein Vi05172_g13232 [Venturia inaequalis]